MLKVPFLSAAILAAAVLSFPVHAQDTSKKEAAVKPALSPSQALLETWNDVGRKLIAMAELMVDPFAHQQMRVSDMAYGFIEHSGEHYGQLVTYYRLAGLVPPESRPKK